MTRVARRVWVGWCVGWSGSGAAGTAARSRRWPRSRPGGLAWRRGCAWRRSRSGRGSDAMATGGSTVGGAVKATRGWAQRRADRRAVARFGEFWQALQEVGDALAEAQRAAKNADDASWKARNQRHW